MKIRRTFAGLFALTILYLAALIWTDSRNQVFAQLPSLLAVLPGLMGIALFSYLIRYMRWRWLLARAGNVTAWLPGFLAYLSGFAFTATPGKVGELIRIRYFQPMGVPPPKVLGAFIYERAFDLIAVLVLSSLALAHNELFPFALAFVAVLLGAIVVMASRPKWISKVAAYLRLRRFKWLARLLVTLREGLLACRLWLTPRDMLVSLALSLAAWAATSFSFVWLVDQLGISLNLSIALAIYPLAMLAGAASMVPGGVGSTEAAIVALLALFGVSVGVAAMAAVGIRIATLWFAVLCGVGACGILEARIKKTCL